MEHVEVLVASRVMLWMTGPGGRASAAWPAVAAVALQKMTEKKSALNDSVAASAAHAITSVAVLAELALTPTDLCQSFLLLLEQIHTLWWLAWWIHD